jgi:hypothetical protein
MSARLALYFEEQLIGSVLDPEVDGFDVYGRWEPSSGQVLDAMMLRLKKVGTVTIRIGDGSTPLVGAVEATPNETIEIKIVNVRASSPSAVGCH